MQIDELARGMSDLLSRTLGASITAETRMAPRLWQISVDANQLENALLNLAINARNAMPNGGRILIETENDNVRESMMLAGSEVSTGQYVRVVLSDSGTGMSEVTLARAFEPFFTTKGADKGTGLGLNQVYGFVRQSGGHIAIDSTVGRGTNVKIYLPRSVSNGEAASARIPGLALLQSGGAPTQEAPDWVARGAWPAAPASSTIQPSPFSTAIHSPHPASARYPALA